MEIVAGTRVGGGNHKCNEVAARATRAFIFLLMVLPGAISGSGRAVLPVFKH